MTENKRITLFSVTAPNKDFGISDLEIKINPVCDNIVNNKKLRKAFRRIFDIILANIKLNMEENKNED